MCSSLSASILALALPISASCSISTGLGGMRRSFGSSILLFSEDGDCALELDEFVLEHAVLDFDVFQQLLEVLTGPLVLALPLIGDLLLLHHDLVGALFLMSMCLFGFQQLILKLGHLDVALVREFVHSIMINDLQSVEFTDGRILLISDRVDQLSQSLVLSEVSFIVTHVSIQLDLDLVHFDLGVLSLVAHGFNFFPLLVALGDEFTIVFAVLHLGLLDSSSVILIFLVGFFFEVSPLAHHAIKLLFKAFALDLVSLLEIDGIGEANLQLGDLIIS